MTDDPLTTLLQQADAVAGRSADAIADLPSRIRRLAARRHRRVRAVGAVTAGVFALSMAAVFNFSKVPADLPAPPLENVAEMRAEIARLQSEADMSTRVVRLTLAIREERARLAELKREFEQPDPVRAARAQLEETASVLVFQADTLYRTPALRSSAVRSYRRAIELFPTTQSARLARARLVAIEQNQGET